MSLQVLIIFKLAFALQQPETSWIVIDKGADLKGFGVDQGAP
jgi:hypothetical protein